MESRHNRPNVPLSAHASHKQKKKKKKSCILYGVRAGGKEILHECITNIAEKLQTGSNFAKALTDGQPGVIKQAR